MQKCEECGKYSLRNEKAKCPYCGGTQLNAIPPKFSLIDKYQKYRLIYFKEEFDKKFNKS
ncbi:MAG: Ribosome biogenesis protein Nop10 [Promethearchaeota archaeon]|nr:MAG: Ribosome biogenesis protein Nop10 [Candidatus Lokiarchaeota archaeon]